MDWWEANVDKRLAERWFARERLPFSHWSNREPVFSAPVDDELVADLAMKTDEPPVDEPEAIVDKPDQVVDNPAPPAKRSHHKKKR